MSHQLVYKPESSLSTVLVCSLKVNKYCNCLSFQRLCILKLFKVFRFPFLSGILNCVVSCLKENKVI